MSTGTNSVQWQRLVKREYYFSYGYPEPYPREEWEDIPEEDRDKYHEVRCWLTTSDIEFVPTISPIEGLHL